MLSTRNSPHVPGFIRERNALVFSTEHAKALQVRMLVWAIHHHLYAIGLSAVLTGPQQKNLEVNHQIPVVLQED